MKRLILIVISMVLLQGFCIAQKNLVEKNIRFYSHVWDEIVNKGNTKMFDSAFSPAVVYNNVNAHLVGLPDFKKYYSEFLTGFSEREFKVLEIYGQGDKIIKRWSFKGKNTGDFAGMPATGKFITLEGVTIAKIEDGKIVEERDYMDDLGLMVQLGRIPNMMK
jgi:hypothetical protein